MKLQKLLFAFLMGLLLSSSFAGAQQPSLSTQLLDAEVSIMKSQINIERSVIFHDNMELTAEEAAIFWPIYSLYEIDKGKTYEQDIYLLIDLNENRTNMTPDKAKKALSQSALSNKQNLRAQNKYSRMVSKQLGDVLALRFMQLDAIFDVMMSAMILEVPLQNGMVNL